MKNTIVLTNTDGEILATLDLKAGQQKVGISPRAGQQLHTIEMPEAYQKHQNAKERGEWLKRYRVKGGALQAKEGKS
jgi:hypothetical protein